MDPLIELMQKEIDIRTEELQLGTPSDYMLYRITVAEIYLLKDLKEQVEKMIYDDEGEEVQ